MKNKYFRDVKNPSMAELVNWFQIEFNDFANDMKDSTHNAKSNEPNPYHLEDGIWAHTMMVCLRAEDDDIVVKLVALLHDVGKPMARDVIPFGAPKPDYNGEARVTNQPTEDKTSQHEREIKTIFRGHEGVSFHLAIEPLEALRVMGVIDYDEMNEILKSISLHSNLFNRIKDGVEHKPEQVVNLFRDIIEYNNFVKSCRNDSTGRFHIDNYKHGRSDTGKMLGKTLYNEDTFYDNIKDDNVWNSWENVHNPTVTILVGLPCSGKSTYLKDLRVLQSADGVIISKDEVIEEIAKERGITYTECFRVMSKDEHKEAYAETMRRYRDAIMKRKNVFVDLTNMSKKSRTKYIHDLKNYNKEAIVFITGQNEINFRNMNRSRAKGKYIHDGVYTQMMKSFLVPTLLDFDRIRYIHS